MCTSPSQLTAQNIFISLLMLLTFYSSVDITVASSQQKINMISNYVNLLMFQAKTEERKLLPQRTESQESDHDEEPRENQKLNKENKPKDKVEK